MATRPICSVSAPLPKKFYDTFWEPCFLFSVCLPVGGRALGFGARERSERVAARRSRAASVAADLYIAKRTPYCHFTKI